MDNTWGTPLYFKPLLLGFDVSISSATKYFSGHSDAMGGTLAVNKKTYSKVKFCDKLLGSRLSADEAYLIIRGIRTLDVRLKAHYENTTKIVNFLKKQKKLKKFCIRINLVLKITKCGKNTILVLQDFFQFL